MTFQIRIGSRSALRLALCLSALTGRGVTSRLRSGLSPGDAASARALAAILGGRLTLTVGGGSGGSSPELGFEPEPERAASAGTDAAAAVRVELPGDVPLVPLVLAATVALAAAGSRDGSVTREVVYEGSTHAPDGESFEVAASCFVPLMARLEAPVELRLDAAGFAPRGEGVIRAVVPPGAALAPISLVSKGPLRAVTIFSGAPASIPAHVQQRQAARARSGVAVAGVEPNVQLVKLKSRKAGSVVAITGLFDDLPVTVSAVSRRGGSVESVGAEAAAEFRRAVSGPSVVPPVLVESLLLAMSVAPGRSELSTWRLPPDMEALAEVVRDVTGREVLVEGKAGNQGGVAVELADSPRTTSY